MKKTFSNKIMKEAVSLSIAALLILSTAAVMANTEEEPRMGGRSGHTMTVENSTAEPGDIGHIVEVTGSWEEEIFGYFVHLYYGPTQVAGDINVTEVNLDGCVGENPLYFGCTVVNGVNGNIEAIIVYTSGPFVPGNGIPAGDGKLINIVVDIAENAETQIVNITDYSPPLNSYYFNVSGNSVYPEFIDGHLEISTNQPPETPDQPDGPSEGEPGVEYTFTGNTTDPDGDDIAYMFDWGDGNYSDWTEFVPSGTEGNASYTWSEEETYDVRVKAKDINGEESGWSPVHTITIEEESLPDLNIKSIEGGKGITVTIENNGDGDATAMDVNITIEGGLIIFPGEYEYPDTIAAGGSVEINMSVFGIGLGIFTPMPEIKVTVECAEGSSVVEDSEEATIFLSKVTIQ